VVGLYVDRLSFVGRYRRTRPSFELVGQEAVAERLIIAVGVDQLVGQVGILQIPRADRFGDPPLLHQFTEPIQVMEHLAEFILEGTRRQPSHAAHFTK
jgi:hypothetical protein